MILVALTRQYHVSPRSKDEATSNVIFVTSNPESVQLVAIIRFAELNEFVVSISIDHPPTLVVAVEYDHSSCGVSSGEGLIPLSTDHEPFSGEVKTGSEGIASEPGRYTNEISGLFAELTLFG